MTRANDLMVYFGSKLKGVGVVALLFLAIGTFGYMWLEPAYNFTEALYMTIITLSTVGYEQIHKPTSELTLWFTMFLILSGVGTLTYGASVFAQELIDGKFVERYKKRKVERTILGLRGHVVICGFGRNGRQAAKKLKRYHTPFVVIEKEMPENITEAFSKDIFVLGDATQEDILLQAGIGKAKGLIVSLPDDSKNLFVTLTARKLNPNLDIISRASSPNSIDKLQMAGANKVVMPDQLGGERMAAGIIMPELADFLERIGIQGNDRVAMQEVSLDNLPQNYLGKTLGEIQFRENTGCTVIAQIRPNDEYVINPSMEACLTPDTRFVLLGTPHQIEALDKHLKTII